MSKRETPLSTPAGVGNAPLTLEHVLVEVKRILDEEREPARSARETEKLAA